MKIHRIYLPFNGQTHELLIRNWLISKLVLANIEISVPVIDNGIDFIVYKTMKITGVRKFVPIQLKSSETKGFQIHTKYNNIKELHYIYVFNVTGNIYFSPNKLQFYVFDMQTLLKIIESLSLQEKESLKKRDIIIEIQFLKRY